MTWTWCFATGRIRDSSHNHCSLLGLPAGRTRRQQSLLPPRHWQREVTRQRGLGCKSLHVLLIYLCAVCGIFRGRRGRALHLKLCILLARTTREISIFMSSSARAEGYNTHAQQREDSTTFMATLVATRLECNGSDLKVVTVTNATQIQP